MTFHNTASPAAHYIELHFQPRKEASAMTSIRRLRLWLGWKIIPRDSIIMETMSPNIRPFWQRFFKREQDA